MTAYLKVSDRRVIVSATETASNTTARTQYATVADNTYAYRQFGSGPGTPLLFLQHFTGTLDNWDPAVNRPSRGRSVSHPVRERRHRAIQRKRCQRPLPAWRITP